MYRNHPETERKFILQQFFFHWFKFPVKNILMTEYRKYRKTITLQLSKLFLLSQSIVKLSLSVRLNFCTGTAVLITKCSLLHL